VKRDIARPGTEAPGPSRGTKRPPAHSRKRGPLMRWIPANVSLRTARSQSRSELKTVKSVVKEIPKPLNQDSTRWLERYGLIEASCLMREREKCIYTGIGTSQCEIGRIPRMVVFTSKKVQVISPLGQKFIKGVILAIADLLKIYEFEFEQGDFNKMAMVWTTSISLWAEEITTSNKLLSLETAVGDACIKYFKLCLARFVAKYRSYGNEEQELADVPKFIRNNDSCILFSGRVFRYVTHHLKFVLGRDFECTEEGTLTFDSFVTSVGALKKAFPRASKELLKSKELAHKTIMTTPQEVKLFENISLLAHFEWPLDSVEEKIFNFRRDYLPLTQDLVKDCVRRTISEVTDGKDPFKDSDRFHPYFPSTSANYVRGRKDGGAVFVIRDVIKECKMTAHVNELFTTFEQPFPEVHGFWGETNQVEAKDRKLNNIPIFGHENNVAAEVVDTTTFDLRYQRLYEVLLSKALEESPYVEPVALAEPLKVRVITKGPPITTTVLKPLQKYLWNLLRGFDQFSLIGQPLDSQILSRVLGNLRGNQRFVSCDYEAATDNLQSWLSETIVDELSTAIHLSQAERLLFRRLLTGHLYEVDGEIKPQMRGQLMGSVVSFVVLCIANAVVCRLTLEFDAGRKIPFSQLQLLVNGDDAAFKASPAGYKYWKFLANFVGLKPSLGKVFYSKYFVELNSRQFTYSPLSWSSYTYTGIHNGKMTTSQRPNYFRAVGFVNLALIYGLKRSAGGKESTTDVVGFDSIGSCLHDAVYLAPVGLESILLGLFIERSKVLKTRFGQVPWFVPASRGGVGLPLIWYRTTYSDDYRSFLRKVESDWWTVQPIHHPAHAVSYQTLREEFELNCVPRLIGCPSNLDLTLCARNVRDERFARPMPSSARWAMRELSSMSFSESNLSNQHQIDESQSFLNKLSIALLFDPDVPDDVLLAAASEFDSVLQSKLMRHNQKLWSFSAGDRSYIKPLSLFSLLYSVDPKRGPSVELFSNIQHDPMSVFERREQNRLANELESLIAW